MAQPKYTVDGMPVFKSKEDFITSGVTEHQALLGMFSIEDIHIIVKLIARHYGKDVGAIATETMAAWNGITIVDEVAKQGCLFIFTFGIKWTAPFFEKICKYRVARETYDKQGNNKVTKAKEIVSLFEGD